MTNPNAVVSDAQSAIAMAITAAVNTSSLYSPSVPNSPCNITLFSRNKFPKSIETAVTATATGTQSGIGKNIAWVDVMRASSPTRNSSEDSEIKRVWIMKHPSALGVFEEIMSAAKMKQIAIFLDYDGTLSPIVENPDQAYMDPQMREAVKNVAKYFPTAIVSGRCRAKVYNFVRLSELYYAGSHGMDIKGPSSRKHQKGNQNVLCQPAKEFLPMMSEVNEILMEKIKDIDGANVENNKFCLSVHYRCVEEHSWSDLADRVKSVLKDYPKLKLTQGRMVLEIRPTIKWDKGKAIEFLLESLGYANSKDVLPIYIGDDRTDEDAFRVLRKRGQGFGILVSKTPKETEAVYSLQQPFEVMQFLQRLVTWKRSILQRNY
ncbi:putative trehalose-phosphatase [Helianthus annuus]|uniref:Trehalose 6-phosphate phosphatase n=1 Tax=Helianthus annuus TaxID=4232 RepID=A0A251TB82_HELAN|nr:probable trehalose-phosphate phosphatase D [Helianthus annuus]KAF5784649.1 putative trehalose-phosphatase [Helianthus annuus]KAJ0512336.1 putative trehalose-phosphatase [Helianthus annuus]KAJ0519795.1 putative trehalose-phosphatase [Helianthus annuus]KAJ0528431.1 putative trehalose-phosphatase [Helianthus annuus]KAJ0695375.1 putative trehalose-phosphatase [Helianthus annuus]